MTESVQKPADPSEHGESETEGRKNRWSRSVAVRYTSHAMFVLNVIGILLIGAIAVIAKIPMRNLTDDFDYQWTGLGLILMETPTWAYIGGSLIFAAALTAKEYFISNRAVTAGIEFVVFILCSLIIFGYAYAVVIAPIVAIHESIQG